MTFGRSSRIVERVRWHVAGRRNSIEIAPRHPPLDAEPVTRRVRTRWDDRNPGRGAAEDTFWLESPGEAQLTGEERERLWRAFRVPIFEQIIGPRGKLLAAECEAHDGLHIETSGLRWEGYRLEQAVCACGRKTPRIACALSVERARSVAAYAK